jgi:hypothetical protein
MSTKQEVAVIKIPVGGKTPSGRRQSIAVIGVGLDGTAFLRPLAKLPKGVELSLKDAVCSLDHRFQFNLGLEGVYGKKKFAKLFAPKPLTDDQVQRIHAITSEKS